MKKLLLSILAFLLALVIVKGQDINFTDEPENLGPNINSPHGEFSPKISPDGKYLFITRDGHPQNVGDPNDDQDIWFSELQEDGSWGLAKNIGTPLNTGNYNFVSSVSPDGNTILLGNVYNYFDGSYSVGTSISYRSRGGWAFPKKQNIEKYENINDYVNYFLSQDGKILLMAIQKKKRKENFGDLDIYFCRNLGENKWSEPENIGPDINTVGTDAGIFLASDGVTMFFASDGHGGYGDSDIFMTKRLDDTWTKWSKPINLGPKINSEDYESNFTIPASGDYAYFASSKNSYGEEDVFRIKLPQEAQPDPVVLVTGHVLNKKTNEPVQASITYELLFEGEEVGIARSEPDNGNYNIVLPYGKNYGFRAYASGFYAISENLDLSTISEYKNIKKNLYLVPIEVGEVVRLNNIFFETAKSELKDESIPELNRVIKLLKENSAIKIELGGHTDNIGSAKSNQKLSQDRAQSVVDFLTKGGISKGRLGANGYGESSPIATNETEEGREWNRRVEFKIISK